MVNIVVNIRPPRALMKIHSDFDHSVFQYLTVIDLLALAVSIFGIL